MRTTHFEYNNSIEIMFYNDDKDIEILQLIEDALMGRAKAALEEDDVEETIKQLEKLMQLEEQLQKMTNLIKYREDGDDESDESDR